MHLFLIFLPTPPPSPASCAPLLERLYRADLMHWFPKPATLTMIMTKQYLVHPSTRLVQFKSILDAQKSKPSFCVKSYGIVHFWPKCNLSNGTTSRLNCHDNFNETETHVKFHPFKISEERKLVLYMQFVFKTGTTGSSDCFLSDVTGLFRGSCFSR